MQLNEDRIYPLTLNVGQDYLLGSAVEAIQTAQDRPADAPQWLQRAHAMIERAMLLGEPEPGAEPEPPPEPEPRPETRTDDDAPSPPMKRGERRVCRGCDTEKGMSAFPRGSWLCHLCIKAGVISPKRGRDRCSEGGARAEAEAEDRDEGDAVGEGTELYLSGAEFRAWLDDGGARDEILRAAQGNHGILDGETVHVISPGGVTVETLTMGDD